jgi:allantoinase
VKIRFRPRRELVRYLLGFDVLERRITAKAAGERIHHVRDAESIQHLRELPFRIRVPDPVPMADDRPLEQDDVACEGDAILARGAVSEIHVVFHDHGVETGEAEQCRQLVEVPVEREADRMRRIGACPADARNVDGAEGRVHRYVVAVVDVVGELSGRAVDEDDVDFGMWNAQGFNRILHGGDASHRLGEAPAAAGGGQKVVQPSVEAKGDVHLTRRLRQNAGRTRAPSSATAHSVTIPRDRAPYSAIVDRRPLPPLPGGHRIVVWTIVNVEVWDISRPMPRTVLPPPTGQPLLPDVANWAWHEYGMRVGFWRFLSLYTRLRITPTLAINGRVCLDYPGVAEAAVAGGWELMGHSFEQGPIHLEPDQPAMIARTLDALERVAGKRPIGWLSPGLTETYETPDHLSAAGVKYIADWAYDDEPTRISTASGPLVTLPYTLECNDIPVIVVQHQGAAGFAQKCIDTFDQLYEESASRPKFMALAVHPYVSGQPGRIRYLASVYEHIARHAGVLHWTGEQILDWYST